MFIDQMQLTLSGGRGGNGLVAWTRKKYIPKGGPCGGNGGPGGSIFIQADSNLVSFDPYRNKKIFKAQNGERQEKKTKHHKIKRKKSKKIG